MSEDASKPKSAFVPFIARIPAPSCDDLITRPFAYYHQSQDKFNPWYHHHGFIGPVTEPSSNCAKEIGRKVGTVEVPDENVPQAVIITSDDLHQSRNSFLNPQSVVHGVDYLNSINPTSTVLQTGVSFASPIYHTVPTPFSGQMLAPAPVVPLIFESPLAQTETFPPRQVLYRKRHHPFDKAASNYEISGSQLKNKTRFSTTGLSGQAAVVRDCKMSLSSSPPSPSAGSVGGSLCSLVPRSHFKPIPSPCQLFSSVRNSGTVFPYSPTKKVSTTSASPTSSSISTLSRSSTSSSSSSSRKRRADDEQRNHRSSGYSSTSDVITGVGLVRLYDRSSTGSVSPVEARTSDWTSTQQPHKRSKNDNDEDDDVIFISMEPGHAASTRKSNVKPKPIRKSKKGTNKMNSNQPSTLLSVPTSIYPIQSLPPCSVTSVNPYSAPASSTISVQPRPLVASNTSLPKGYYLRSSVTAKTDVSANVKASQYNPSEVYSNACEGARYNTRSHQKRQLETSHVSPQIYQVESSSVVGDVRNVQKIVAKANLAASSQEQTQAEKPSPTYVTASASFGPCKKPNVVILNESHSKNVRVSSFGKIYDIKGKIGVGGGGVVYAGSRKSDNAQVAIKRVPKEKVKRWGKLDGRVVPIEFELLHRAAMSGNRGVIKMFDWYERRSSYILVMERPQPVIDLFDYLNQHGAMPETTAKKIFRQIVEAVRHCHANGVVHRDIKDENVLLNLHTSEAKLIDFGCGTFMKNEPYTEFAGTPEFYPPEWFTERRYEGRKVDAWSLGVLLYTMVEAEVPFQKEGDIVRCELRHKRLIAPSSSLCRHLIAMMLEKDQSKRPTLEEVLRHPWLNEGPVLAPSNLGTSAASKTEDQTDLSAVSKPPIQNFSKTCASEKQLYQVNDISQYKEKSRGFNSPSYLASPLSHNVVRSKECVVHS